jgi:GYF domain 2
MHYHVSRDGQTYGPYTLEDLQRYVASGNVLPTDMAKTDEMTDWVPVSEILAGSAMPVAAFSTPGYANPGYVSAVYVDPAANQAALAASPYQDAPNLHWGLYWLFSWITCTLFSKVMTLVQAAWLKRVQPNSMAIVAYAAQYGILILSIVVRSLTHTLIQDQTNTYNFRFGVYTHQNPLVSLLNLTYFIMIFVSRFIMRASLEEHFNTVEPVGLRLNPVMTFFFGGIYFQYHLNKINEMKQAARFGAPRQF